MPLIGKIREAAQNSLVEAKLIKAEEGPTKVKKLVDKLTQKAAKADKSELARMSNYDIFVTFTYLLNSENFSYDETLSYCEEVKRYIMSWTFEKDSKRLDAIQSKTNEDGSFMDWSCANLMTELGLTPVFVNFKMKLVYLAMYHFLKLKKDILSQADYIKKLSIPQRIQWMKSVYKNSSFSNFVDFAKQILDNDMEDHEFRQEVSAKRIAVTEQLLKMIEEETFDKLIELPNDWHQYLDPTVLEPTYDVVHTNIVRRKLELDNEEQELISKRDKSELTKYLYAHSLNPYSLSESELSELESIPNIISKIEFFKSIGIPVNNILTIHKDYLTSLENDHLEYIKFLVDSNVLSKQTLREHLSIINQDYQRIISNYKILKDIVDFNNIFYKDTILLQDIRDIKNILSVLKEYKLSINNYIFLLCNYEYLSLYDLIIENEIPDELFISICKTENPLNTVKRILIYKSIGEEYKTPTNFLKKDVTSESKFICLDESLDEYLPNIIDQNGLNLLSGETINKIVNNPIVQQLDKDYRVDNTYMIGGTIISRPKFLRNFELVQGNADYLVISLVSGSILDEKEYYELTKELKQNTKK